MSYVANRTITIPVIIIVSAIISYTGYIVYQNILGNTTTITQIQSCTIDNQLPTSGQPEYQIRTHNLLSRPPINNKDKQSSSHKR